jgi:CheY-like chemotaxis protein
LKADAATATIASIAVSANAMGPDIDRALQAGFADYLVKPVNVRQLLALVDRLRS